MIPSEVLFGMRDPGYGIPWIRDFPATASRIIASLIGFQVSDFDIRISDFP